MNMIGSESVIYRHWVKWVKDHYPVIVQMDWITEQLDGYAASLVIYDHIESPMMDVKILDDPNSFIWFKSKSHMTCFILRFSSH